MTMDPNAPGERGPAPTPPSATTDATLVELYLLRHADAGDPAAWTGDDAERPLSPKGKRQARRLAQHLSDRRWRPDVVVTSPKLRARQTADEVGRKLGRKPVEDDRLGANLQLAGVRDVLAAHSKARRVLLVGHDPDFSAIVSSLTGASIEVRKGALVRIDLPGGRATTRSGVLRWLIPPTVVPR